MADEIILIAETICSNGYLEYLIDTPVNPIREREKKRERERGRERERERER